MVLAREAGKYIARNIVPTACAPPQKAIESWRMPFCGGTPDRTVDPILPQTRRIYLACVTRDNRWVKNQVFFARTARITFAPKPLCHRALESW